MSISLGDAHAKGPDEYQERMKLYKKVETVTQMPWYYLAAIDQYERNIRQVRKDLPKPESVIGIYFPPEKWAGVTNPNPQDENPAIIQFFNGMGVDGDGDGKASLKSDEDVLYAFANYLLSYGIDHDNIKIGLWNYYHRDKTVGIIVGKAKIYRHFGRLDLDTHVFPFHYEAITAIAVPGVMREAGVAEEFMKVQIFLQATVFLFEQQTMELSK